MIKFGKYLNRGVQYRTGEAGKRQVKKHPIGMTENGGGTAGNGQVAMTTHVLEKKIHQPK